MKSFTRKHKFSFFVALLLTFFLTISIFVRTTNDIQSDDSTEIKAATPVHTTSSPDETKTETVVQDLNVPWEVVFLPNSIGEFPNEPEFLITQRNGTILRISGDRNTYNVPDVKVVGEGGLLGLALHPDFNENSLIYVYLTSDVGNKVVRYLLTENHLENPEVILENIPEAPNHNGGRIAFGPDGFLYISTGDSQNENLAQDTDSLAGKILRVTDDGKIPSDNPFKNAVYSYGHRNVQGITWDEDGRLWATEHGRSGLRSGYDELNLIKKGANYGWPVIQGDEIRENMQRPVIHSGASETWAPSGITYFNNSLFFTGLRGQALYQAKLAANGETTTELIKHFDGTFGRIRTVRLGPDGYLYILTNNTDGRGNPQKNDDKLIRVNPEVLFK